jgi:hypothetical protein
VVEAAATSGPRGTWRARGEGSTGPRAQRGAGPCLPPKSARPASPRRERGPFGGTSLLEAAGPPCSPSSIQGRPDMSSAADIVWETLEQAYGTLHANVRGVSLDEALFVPSGRYRSILGTLKHAAGWSTSIDRMPLMRPRAAGPRSSGQGRSGPPSARTRRTWRRSSPGSIPRTSGGSGICRGSRRPSCPHLGRSIGVERRLSTGSWP